MYSPLVRNLIRQKMKYLRWIWMGLFGIFILVGGLLLWRVSSSGLPPQKIAKGLIYFNFIMSLVFAFLALNIPKMFETLWMGSLYDAREKQQDVVPPPLSSGTVKDDFSKMTQPEQGIFYLFSAVFLGRLTSYILCVVPFCCGLYLSTSSQQARAGAPFIIAALFIMFFHRPRGEKEYSRRWKRQIQ